MQVVIITGVSGFLGRYIAQHFHAAGWRVVGIDLAGEENSPTEYVHRYIASRLPNPSFDDCLKEESPSLVIHSAGRASVGLSVSDPLPDFEGNAVLTFQILESMRLHASNCGFILLSSAAVYGNPKEQPVSESTSPAPISPYGFHKWTAELTANEFAKVYGMRTASVRIFSAYGPGLRRQVLWDLTNKAVKHDKLRLIGTGDETRDFIHARDVANAVNCVGLQGALIGEVYNVASGTETPVVALAQQILDALGLPSPIEFDGQLPKGVPTKWRADISKLLKLGYVQTVPFHQGVDEYVHWARALIG